MKILPYSIGTGDRFGRQGKAQLAAVLKAARNGLDLAIVWNKSHREHMLINTSPADVRKEADQAARALNFQGQYFVDADHIGLANVDLFMDHSDFFTLDVADFIGQKADEKSLNAFVTAHGSLMGTLDLEGLGQPLDISSEKLRRIAEKYLFAVQKAGKTFRHIKKAKPEGSFVIEVSMDETLEPQTPMELLVILAAIAHEKIPAQTIAPKFCGEFHKGVDYIGDVKRFAREFEDDLCILNHAVSCLDLPKDLKLSIHSGSDKFKIYPVMGKLIKKHGAGLHLKTAGTTWLEELIGLSHAGGDALGIVKEIYALSLARFDELCAPYAAVVAIDKDRLPSPKTVASWSGDQMARALEHNQACPDYDTSLRQLFHVGFKIAAEMGDDFFEALDTHSEIIGANVTYNLYERHIVPLFLTDTI